MKFCFTIFFVFINNLFTFGKDIPVLDSSDLPGYDIETKYYDGNSLWGYINGGADVYLEYGFEKLTLQLIYFNDQPIKVEIYRMTDDKAAFGIFSISYFKCNEISLPTKYYCINDYHIQIAKGQDYISIINETGNKETLDFCITLANKLIEKSKERDFDIPSILLNDTTKDFLSNMKYCRGPLGLQNGFSDFKEALPVNIQFNLFYLLFKCNGIDFSVVYLEFQNDNDFQKFIDTNNISFNTIKVSVDSEDMKSSYSTEVGKNKIIIGYTNHSNCKLSKIINTYFKR
ncbi:DUF6599 family protein [Bacteroidota bacterium]